MTTRWLRDPSDATTVHSSADIRHVHFPMERTHCGMEILSKPITKLKTYHVKCVKCKEREKR